MTIRYLEADFADLFIAALGGLGPDGAPDGGYRGRELARNSAVAKLALACGLRRQEFSYLLAYEVPRLPPSPGRLPVPFPVPAEVTKGRKFRGTMPAGQEVIEESHTDKQTSLLVRTSEPVYDPAWAVTPVSLEDLVIAYMNPANEIPASRPQLGVVS